MIVQGSTSLLALARDHWPRLVGVVVVVAVTELANMRLEFARPAFSLATVGLLVAGLSFFLIFRVGEAYERWWEARKLWGEIVNDSRSFARQATTLLQAPAQDAQARSAVERLQSELVYRQVAWVNAVRITLRGQDSWEELAPFLPADELAALDGIADKPTQILQVQGARIAGARAAGWLSELGQRTFDVTLAGLQTSQGGCERIKKTAMPDRLSYFAQVVAWAIAISIAVALIDADAGFDWIDLAVVPLLMAAFLITERLGAELKNPFESRPNDTPMSAICRTIEINLRQQLGESDVPPPLEPVKGVLM